MAITDTGYPLVTEEFVDGFRLQSEWSWLIAIAFFLGGIGAGLFLVSLYLKFKIGAFIGLLIVVLGKGGAHFLYLGHPLRFWRSVSKPLSSWISRGMIGMLLFIISGFLYCAAVVPFFSWVTIPEGTLFYKTVVYLAILSAFILTIYDGFVMSSSPSIPFWNSTLLPVLCSSYAFLGGLTLTIILIYLGSFPIPVNMGFLESAESVLIVLNLFLILVYLMTMFHSTITAKVSTFLLIKERYALPFLLGGIFVGFILTGTLAFYFSATSQTLALVGLALAELTGDFFIRFFFLRVGAYAPIGQKIR